MAEVAVITGASAGIGRATDPEFASHGCSITLLARGCASAITMVWASEHRKWIAGGAAMALGAGLVTARRLERR
jgi:NADP-dependent 3-hydroxy acid dehydrogenase YdfG